MFIKLPLNGSMNPGCHGGHHSVKISKFYKDGPPQSLDWCTDELVWLEFEKTLRIYYMFDPWMRTEGIDDALKMFGSGLDQMDVLVCNECNQLTKGEKDSFFQSDDAAVKKQFIDFGPVRTNLRAQLERDSGDSYGATNAISQDDSLHCCMPGLPDDEVDILFTAIATGRNCTFIGPCNLIAMYYQPGCGTLRKCRKRSEVILNFNASNQESLLGLRNAWMQEVRVGDTTYLCGVFQP